MDWLLNLSMKSIDIASSRSPSSSTFLFLYLHDSYKDQAQLVKEVRSGGEERSDDPSLQSPINPSLVSCSSLRSSPSLQSDFSNVELHVNPSKSTVIDSLSSCGRLNTVRLDADDILHPSFILNLADAAKSATGVVTYGAMSLPMLTLSRSESGALNCNQQHRGHRKGAKHLYHFSLGQTVSVPYNLWKEKAPATMNWGNHVHVEKTLRTTFQGTKVSAVDFKQDPGYYTITSLSGHFPFEHPKACNLER